MAGMTPPGTGSQPPHSSAWAAFVEGWRRVIHAPALLAGVYVVTLAMAVPLAVALRAELAQHLGRSVEAGAAADGVNWGWWQEFRGQAGPLGETFSPTIIGFAPVLSTWSTLLEGSLVAAPVRGVLVAYLLVWTWLSGGLIDRVARQRAGGAWVFGAAVGRNGWRLSRLAVLTAGAYWLIFTRAHPWVSDWFTTATQDLDSERHAAAWAVALGLPMVGLVAGVAVLFDYAKVRVVVEDRRSAVGALVAAVRFVARRWRAVIVLGALEAAAYLAMLAVWALVAPGIGGSGWSMGWRLLVGQTYVVGRLALHLQTIAAATALFQGSLAHAHYAAAPHPDWPPSPAEDAITPQRSGQFKTPPAQQARG